MPAKLPANSGFTYCVELKVDGVARVRFTEPVALWVDNFLGFDVGTIVPVGYFDRDRGVWVPADNGVVVRLLDVDTDGLVDGLDADGDALPDDLDGDGSVADEVAGLESGYAVGATLWRAEVTHFSPWDLNWPITPPPDAVAPNPSSAPFSGLHNTAGGRSSRCISSSVEEKSRAYHEDIPIPGTDLTLHYDSARVDGYQTQITVPASGDAVPSSLKEIRVRVEVAGRVLEQVLPPLANQVAEFVWDGLDYLGRPRGSSSAHVRIGFVYDGEYLLPGDYTQSFGQTGTTSTNVVGRQELIEWQDRHVFVLGRAQEDIAEGWTLSSHHYVDPGHISVLHKGDGSVVRNNASIVTTVLGNGTFGFSGDGGPAAAAQIASGGALAFDAAGNLYFADTGNSRIRRVDRNGVVTTVAGRGQRYAPNPYFMGGFGGDGGPATDAYMYAPSDVAVDAAGNLYIADWGNHRIRKVDTNGIITTVAGSGCSSETSYCYGGFSGDGGPATNALLKRPLEIEVDRDGNLYILDYGNYRIRKVDTNGIITTIAGNGSSGLFVGEGGPAIDATLYAEHFTIDDKGALYALLDGDSRLCKIDSRVSSRQSPEAMDPVSVVMVGRR